MLLSKWEKKGYKIISTSSNNRYIHVILKKDKYYFLKLSKKNSPNLSNEAVWNDKINKLSAGKNFCCPLVIESGKNYALFEYFSKPIGNDFGKFIPKIVDLLFWINGLKFNLPLDNAKNVKIGLGRPSVNMLRNRRFLHVRNDRCRFKQSGGILRVLSMI